MPSYRHEAIVKKHEGNHRKCYKDYLKPELNFPETWVWDKGRHFRIPELQEFNFEPLKKKKRAT